MSAKVFQYFHPFILALGLAGWVSIGVPGPGGAMGAESANGITPNPVLGRFNQAITFYGSFDGHATADLSTGKGAPIANARKLQWVDGNRGQALRGRAKALIYRAKDNIDLSKPGSLMLWISPDRWPDEAKVRQLPFASITNHGRTLYLARQGGKGNKQALMAIFGPNVSDRRTRALVKNGSTRQWRAGRWHLLAVNWNGEDYVELSVDGGLFKRGIASQVWPEPTDGPGQIRLAAGDHGNTPYQMDELSILDRPLNNKEVRRVYQSMTTNQ